MTGSTSSRRRRYSRRTRLLVLATVLALVVAVPLAWASHGFTDVPDANPFHDDIDAISGAGITAGKTCVPPGTPPTYCPDEPVTRQAMAAFMHRGFGRVGSRTGPDTLIDDSEVDLESLDIPVGGVPGELQFVKLDAVVTTYISSLSGCPCDTEYWIEQDGVGRISGSRFHTNSVLGSTGPGYETGAVTATAVVDTGETATFRVRATRFGTVTGTVRGWGSLSGITAPFAAPSPLPQ